MSILAKPRKPAPLFPWQAYGAVFCQKKTLLHDHVHTDFNDLRAEKLSTIAKYSHLLANLDRDLIANISWLRFFQLIMTNLVKNATADELKVVATHIES